MKVYLEAWAGHSGQHADPRDCGYGAKRGMCFGLTAHNGFNTGDDSDIADRAVARTPGGAVGQAASVPPFTDVAVDSCLRSTYLNFCC